MDSLGSCRCGGIACTMGELPCVDTGALGHPSWDCEEGELLSMRESSRNVWSSDLGWMMNQLRACAWRLVQINTSYVVMGVCCRPSDQGNEWDFLQTHHGRASCLQFLFVMKDLKHSSVLRSDSTGTGVFWSIFEANPWHKWSGNQQRKMFCCTSHLKIMKTCLEI